MPKPKPYYIPGSPLSRELYIKLQRIAEVEDRSMCAVIRRLIAEAPEPQPAQK